MNEYSKGTQIAAVIISEIIAYLLTIYNPIFRLVSTIDFLDFLTIVTIFASPIIYMVIPILFVYIKYKCKFLFILFSIPLIFICALVYLPDGFYLLFMKGTFGWNPSYEYKEPWVYATWLTVEFFVVQLITVAIVKEAQKYPTDKMIDEDEKDKK